MEFVISEKPIGASRHIEEMLEKLIYIEINLLKRSYKYHVFYENGKKPQLDIAIDRETGCITSINFFLMNEKVYQKCPDVEISIVDKSLKIISNEFSRDKMHMVLDKEFNSYLTENAFYYLDKNNKEKELIGYYLSEDSYILMNQKNMFMGIYFNNLSNEEKNLLNIDLF